MPKEAPTAPEDLAQLQQEADRCAALFRSYRFKQTLRVLAVSGARYPWRVVEAHISAGETVVRQMHCFSSSTKLYHWLRERQDWKTHDRALAAARLVHARRALEPAEESPLAHARRLYDSLSQDLAAIAGERQALESALRPTRADAIMRLPLSRDRAHKL